LKVTLLAYTPDPVELVAGAAKLCYSPASIDDIRSRLSPESASRFVDMLTQIGHESPIEHASFTFGVEGVSRSLLAQLTRHRIASYSVQSQRYVSEDDFGYVIPPEIEADPEAKSEFLKAMDEDRRHYDRLARRLAALHKARLMAEGMDEDKAAAAAEKKAIEDARYVLPNACATKLIVTMNARSLRNFFRHRCCSRAQWEIRALAEEMLRLVRRAAPSLFETAGPSCLDGPCPEGKMSCGRSAEMREKYKTL